jgi:adenylosuccinate lyase
MGGLIFSESILLALTRKGLSREEAYGVVQRNAMRVWEKGEDFKTLLFQDETIKRLLTEKELATLLDVRAHLRHVDDIFRRVFGEA